MWKQFLSKLPKKSSPSLKYGKGSVSGEDACGSNPPGSAASQRTGGPGDAAAMTLSSANMKRMSSAVFPSSVVAGIEPLVPFKDVPNAEKSNLFISKLSLCCVVFDFSDLNKNSSEKEVKRQILVDLIDFVHSGNIRFTEPMIAASCKMFAANLFRVFPPNYQATGGGEGEEDEPSFEPAWPHLHLVYELLMKFISSASHEAKIGKKFFDHSFILKLLELFDSEDPRERECLKMVLHKIYGKFMVHRPFIRKAVSNIFYRFMFETEKHNGVADLLEVFGSIISGFALPLKEEHKIFLHRVLIPLHKPKTLGVYLQQLTYCVTQFIEKEPKLASRVIDGLLKFWPITNSQKEVMFLSEVEEILESTNVHEFQKSVLLLFRRLASCVNSSHFQVAERALFMWNNDHILGLVAQNREVVFPIMIPALERNCTGHWNHAVVNLTVNVKNMFLEMDQELYSSCLRQFKEQEQKQQAMDDERRTVWEQLESAATFQPVTGNTAVLVGH